MTICIIPARGNSKRIKNKNIINFYGKPIIYYSILLAKKSKLFSRIVVSTDDNKIAKIAKKYGAEVPFIRSKKLSNDYVNSTDVVIDTIKKIFSEKEKYHCCLYPTSVLTKKDDLIRALRKIKKTNAECIIPVTDYNYNPYRSFKQNGKKWISFLFKKYSKTRSQDLPNLYHDTGTFYFFKTSSILSNKKNFSKKTTFLKIDRIRTTDINEPKDLIMAKLQYKLINKRL